jgi:hypothetical protein
MQDSQKPNHLKDLVLLFAIPIGIAIFTAAAIYIPRLLADPKYDFIYSVCDNYDCEDSYSVGATGHIIKEPSKPSNSTYGKGISTIRYYDTVNDSTKSLMLGEAQKYKLNRSSKSPDGYSLAQDNSDSGLLFWGNHGKDWYLKDGSKKKKIELINNESYYSQDITFLGWIEK